MTMITAHSGCEDTVDNSMEFVTLALSLPVDCLEVDIRYGKNGTLVLSHDAPLTDAPLLKDLFHLLAKNTHMRVNCDLKEEGLELDVWRLAERMGVENRLIYSGSVGLDVLRKQPWLAQRVEIFLNLELFQDHFEDMNPNAQKIAWESAGKSCCMLGVSCLNINYHLCSDACFSVLDQLGVRVSAWTPDQPLDIDRLLRLHAYNITTRRPYSCLQRRTSV